MLGYIIRRLAGMVPTLFIVLLCGFIIIQAPPGDYISKLQGRLEGGTLSPAMLKRLRESLGLGEPIHVQFLKWVGGMFHGDLGWSFVYNEPVGSLIAESIGYTLLLGGAAIVVSTLLGFLIGVYSAVHKYTFFDYVFTISAYLGRATPPFFIAMVLLFIQGFWFNKASITGFHSSEFAGVARWTIPKIIDFLRHFWAPLIAVGAPYAAMIARITRGNLLDILPEQYVQTARAKGLLERVVIYKHAVRNSLHPLIMFVGLFFPQVIEATMIASIVLTLPTMGYYYYQGLLGQDMYLAGGILIVIVLLMMIGNFLADIALAIADPTVTYD